MKQTIKDITGAIAIAVTLLVLMSLAADVQADGPEKTLNWEPPTTREDGTSFDAATEGDYYTLHCGADPESPRGAAEVEIPAVNDTGNHTIALDDTFSERGEFHCVLTITDTQGLTSADSESIEIPFDPSAPSAVTQLTITTESPESSEED